MKLFSGKRRGFSKSASEIQAFVGAAWWCLISDDSAALSQAPSDAALLWRFTQRTVGFAPQSRMKFVPLRSSSAAWAASPTGIGVVSYSEHFL